jgi:phage gp36-like protein
LPLVSWSPDLTRAVCNIAAYDLMVRRGYNPEAGPDANIRDRYNDAIKWLTQVAQGAVTPVLVDSTPGGVPQPFVHSKPPRGW